MPQYPYAPVNNELGAIATLTLASANGNTADLTNPMGRGVQVVVDVTALAGTSPTLTVTIEGKDPASGTYFTLLAGAVLDATGVVAMLVYPGATVAANVAVSQPVPPTWRVAWAIGGTTPEVTATIGACILV